jgi:hypothetical protein
MKNILFLIFTLLFFGCASVPFKYYPPIDPENKTEAKKIISEVLESSLKIQGKKGEVIVTDNWYLIGVGVIEFDDIKEVSVVGKVKGAEVDLKDWDMESPYYVKFGRKGSYDDIVIYTKTLKDAQRLGGALEFMKKEE